MLGPFKVIKKPLTLGVAQASAPEKGDPLIWWKLDETEGPAVANASGKGPAGSVYGEARWAPGKGANAGALELDGAGNFVEAVNSENMDFRNGVTVSTWFKIRQAGKGNESLAAKGESWRLQRLGDNGFLEFGVRGPATGKTEAGARSQMVSLVGKHGVSDTEWHHAAITYDGKRAVLYLDGAEEASIAAKGTISPNNLPVTVGDNWAYPGRRFSGWMDDVRVYTRGLSADEVKELAKKSVTVTSTN